MSDTVHGSCLCGKVRFKVTRPFKSFFVCHCSRCRKTTGSAHASNIFTTPDHVHWLAGEDLVRHFKLESAKRFGHSFCTECGSPVPRVSEERNVATIPAGVLDDDPGMSPQNIIFWNDRTDWYEDMAMAPHFAEYPDK